MPTRDIENDPAYVKRAFDASLDQLLDKDIALLLAGASEWTISHRLAVYLEPWFSTFNVDCEYNRRGFRAKTSPDESWFRPDIIVHERLLSSANLLAVDVKCTTNPQGYDVSDDFYHLIDTNNYNYSHAVFLLVHTKRIELLDQNRPRVSGFWGNDRNHDHDRFERCFPLSAIQKDLVERNRRRDRP